MLAGKHEKWMIITERLNLAHLRITGTKTRKVAENNRKLKLGVLLKHWQENTESG